MKCDSDQAKNPSDCLIGEVGSRAPRTEEGTDNGKESDKQELAPGEKNFHSGVQEEVELQDHGVADDCADEHAKGAGAEDQYERFVEVEGAHAVPSEAHCPQDCHFFLLLVKVGCHARAEREEAEEHGH